jgi:hypothetical protein
MSMPADPELGYEYEWPTSAAGVLSVHAGSCGVRDGEPCSCGPLGYCASRIDPSTGRRVVSPLLGSESAARSWSAGSAPPRPTASPPAAGRIDELIDDFLAAAADGRARTPAGRRYTEADLTELRSALRGHVAVELGDAAPASLRHWQVQAFVNELSDSGLSARRMRGIVGSLRALYQYAVETGAVHANPVDRVMVATEDHPDRSTGEERAPFTTTDQISAVPSSGNAPFIPDQMLWQFVKIATVIFVLIALVLVAESV